MLPVRAVASSSPPPCSTAFPYPGDLDPERLVDPRDGPSRLVYAGHLYEFSTHDGLGYPPDSPYVADWERMRSEEAAALDAALWFGEWGGPADQDRFDTYVDFAWDATDRTFTMTRTERDDATGATIITVPATLYPDGIDVTMTDADAAWRHEWDEERGRLTIDADRSADEHTLTLTPAR